MLDPCAADRKDGKTKGLSVLRRVELANRYVDECTSSGFDSVTHVLLDNVLTSIGTAVERITINYFYGAPEWLSEGMDEFVAKVWRVIHPELRSSIVNNVSGDFQSLLLLGWSIQYPPFWVRGDVFPQPYTWLRARYLYAYYPADKCLFQKVANPLYIIILALKMSSHTCVPIFILQYFFIDKSDEYQVCNLILSFKSYQFLTAIYTATALSYTFHGCLSSPGYIEGQPRSCDAFMPTSAPDFDMIMLMELPRLLTLVAATLLLRLGHTRGGIGELRALAEVRLDAADGTLDGFAHIAKIELNAVGEEKTYNLRTIPRRVWNTHIREAQRRIGTEVGTGGYLQTWMVFDFGVLATVFTLMMVPFVWRALEQYRADGTPPDAVELRNTLYYVTISWALMSFPFLVFHLPIIGVALSTPCTRLRA